MSWYNQCHGIINVLPRGHGRAGGRLESLVCSFNCFVVIQYITDMYIIATTLNLTFNIMIITKTDYKRMVGIRGELLLSNILCPPW